MTNLTALRTLEDLPGPPGIPLLGNALQAPPVRLHLVAERWCREHGPLFRFRLGPSDVIGVGDSEVIADLLRRRPNEFRRWSEIAASARETGTCGVFAAEGDDWRRMRRLTVTALNSAHLHRYYEVIDAAALRLHDRLVRAALSGEPVAIAEELQTFTLETTIGLVFGCDPIANDLRRDVQRVFDMTARRVASPVPYWRWLKLPVDRADERSVVRLRAALVEFVSIARARMHARPELHERPENLLEATLAAQAADGRFSEDELFGNAMTLLLAGVDTTSSTLAWAAWFVGRDAVLADRAAAEAGTLLEGATTAASYEAAASFAYGEAILREVTRLRSTAPVIFLESLSETIVGDVLVPAGTKLLLLTRHASVQEERFVDAERLDPERWLHAPNGAHDPKALMSFGAGPRFCPGRNLAFLEGKAALAMLAQAFEIEIEPGEVRERFAFTMSPDGLRVRLRPRRPASG